MGRQFPTTCSALFMAAISAADPAVGLAQPAPPPVLVMLQNDASAPVNVVSRAQAEVVRLFDLIGVEVVWVPAIEGHGRLPRVVSLTTWEPPEERLPASVLGYTQAGEHTRGVRAYVFWRRIERDSQKFAVGHANLLAAAIAHELGHMLLPNGSHSKTGLMHGSWDPGHFRSVAAGLLHFSRESAAAIQRGMMQHTADLAARGPRQ